MPGGFPTGLEFCGVQVAGALVGTQPWYGTQITAGTPANTKGSYTQLTAATTVDACWISIHTMYTNNAVAGAATLAFDVAIGGAGSEVIIAKDLVAASAVQYSFDEGYYKFPCAIKAGTRLSARVQCSTASVADLYLTVTLFEGSMTDMEGFCGVDMYGFAAGAATFVTPGASAFGSYTTITAATTREYIGLMAHFNNSGQQDTTNYPNCTANIAIGAAASEKDIIQFHTFCYNSNKGSMMPFYPVKVPLGTRLSVRAASVIGSTTNRIGVVLYGVY